jgi:hypothetical protein
MDPQLAQILQFVGNILPYVAVITVAGVAGSVFSTWLKIKNGYPLSSSWGFPLHPKTDRESAERITLLTNENAQLRAQIGSMSDRLQTIERIITDQPNRLARDIDALATDKGGHA